MSGGGWIKVHRRILEWEWFDHPKMLQFFMRLLFKANYEPKQWQGITIQRGQFVCSWEQLALATGLTIQNTRTLLSKLESTGEVARKSTNKFTIITICKYESYQSLVDQNDTTTNKQLTNNQQTTNKQLTTTKEGKEVKKERTNKRESTRAKVFVPPEVIEVIEYFKQNGYTAESAKRAFNYYSVAEWIDGRGNKVRNWKQKMQSVWFKDENINHQKPKSTSSAII